MIKATRTVTVAMFAIILATPFLQEHLHLYKYRPLTENRLKIPRPTNWRTLFETGTPFAKKYEEYFNDNYGMRDLLIRTKNSLDYRLFRKSEKIVIGPDNWLFYRNVIEDMEILLEKTCDQLCPPMYERFLKLHRGAGRPRHNAGHAPLPHEEHHLSGDASRNRSPQARS